MTRPTQDDLRAGRRRRGSVAIMAALLALPLIGIVGLAIDFAMYSQTNSALTAAARAAALNAVKVAATGAAAGNATYVQDGQNAGLQWFQAQAGTTSLTVGKLISNVTVTPGTTIKATLTSTAQVPSLFGAIFGVKTYNISINAQAEQTLAPFVEVVMLLDNSSSMSIGATPADMATLMQNSPCDPSNYYSATTSGQYGSNITYQRYAVYECSDNGGTYDGQSSPWNGPACPFSSGNTTYTYQSASGTYNVANNPSSSTSSQYGSNFTCPGKVNGYAIYPGPPCAFACHSDDSAKAGNGNDLWAMARKNGVTLRSDVLKNATQDIISSLQTRDPNGTSLSLGVYSFATGLFTAYPSSGEAGSNWSAASTAVGFPPVAKSGKYTDSGIQPAVAYPTSPPNPSVNNNTNFSKAMNTLATTVTAAGSGASAGSPRKVLFLLTDGMDDENSSVSGTLPNNPRAAMPSSYCQQFKDMGYKVYVLYTKYYPLMEQTYLSSLMSIVEGTDSNSISYNLQQCSSSTGASDLSTYYIEATDQASVNSALQAFLTSALTSPASYTQ